MTEQDKPTLVPAVLNDLVDVDGEPADGEGLVRRDGAWRPATAGGLLPENGPAYCQWSSDVNTGDLANDAAIKAAWLAIEPDFLTNDAGPTPMGEWGTAYSNVLTWRATEPGIYGLYSRRFMNINAAVGANSWAFFMPIISAINDYWWGADLVASRVVSPTHYHVDNMTMLISQQMIDAGYGGVDFGAPRYTPHGAERVNNLGIFLGVERYSPGSAIEYLSGM